MQASPSPVLFARSLLFVPATRPERFAKAFDSGADCIIIDLEDAVSPESKDAARDQLAQHLPLFSPVQLARILVRVNAAGTEWHDRDIELLGDWTRQSLTVMLPKSEDAAVVSRVGEKLGPGARIVALVESLAGLDAADSLAREKHVVRLAFGHLDFQLDLGMCASPDEHELAFARNALVAASRRSRLPAPIDGVTTDTGNADRLAADVRSSRAFGFGGKLCIHPAQVAGIHEALGYSEAEQSWAHRVLAEAAKRVGAAFSLDGRMVDLPVVRAAQKIVAGVQK